SAQKACQPVDERIPDAEGADTGLGPGDDLVEGSLAWQDPLDHGAFLGVESSYAVPGIGQTQFKYVGVARRAPGLDSDPTAGPREPAERIGHRFGTLLEPEQVIKARVAEVRESPGVLYLAQQVQFDALVGH